MILYPLTPPLMEMLILTIINKEDSYGYQISQELKSVSNLKDSALYPVLKRLSENGFVQVYDRQIQGRNRKYYRMTEQGRNYYRTLVLGWTEYTDRIQVFMQRNRGMGGVCDE